MNTKRQTIWLVSMLSLMVLLSAYYLFTNDMNDADKLTETDSQLSGTEVVGGGDPADEPGNISVINQQVLEQLEREGLNLGMFGDLMAKKEQQVSEEFSRIDAILSDVSNDQETTSAALADQELLEDKLDRIASIESELLEQYEMALISTEANDRYKVVVASDKLERKEAASIIEQVMNVMEVAPSQVSVQFVAKP